MGEWDAKCYDKFQKERVQPSIDLVNRIMIENPKRIIDVGCGSGMSTKILADRFKNAEIIGLDNSQSMLNKAKQLELNVEWIFKDCNESLEAFDKADIIFANASLQWLKAQDQVIANWFKALNPRGIMAVQIPLFEQMKMQEILLEIRTKEKWRDYFKEVDAHTYHNFTPEWYYDVVSKYSDEIEMWETDYYNILNGYEAIIEFSRSTAFRAYLIALAETELESEFIEEIFQKVKENYKLQADGKIDYKFKRLFIVVTARKES